MTRLLDTSPRLRAAVRWAARLVNPVVLALAGRSWMPVLGVVRHRGRRSDRPHATPLGMRAAGAGLAVPFTFGERAAWYLNLVAAGSVRVTYLGRSHVLAAGAVVGYAEAAPAFPAYERLLFRLLGIDRFLLLVPAAPEKEMTPTDRLSGSGTDLAVTSVSFERFPRGRAEL